MSVKTAAKPASKDFKPSGGANPAYWDNYWESSHRDGAGYGKQSSGPVQCMIAEALKNEGLLRGKRVLEIGCGNGRINELLEGVRYTGIDFSTSAIALSKKRVLEKRHELMSNSYSFVTADATKRLPLNRATFDLAFSTETFHLFGSVLPNVLENVARVIKPGGVLIFDTLCDNTTTSLAFATKGFERFELDFGTVFKRDEEELIRNDSTQIRLALERAGFDPIRTKTWGFNETHLHLLESYPKAYKNDLQPVGQEFNYFCISRAIRT